MGRLAKTCQTASDVLERLCLFGAGALLVVNLAAVMLGVALLVSAPATALVRAVLDAVVGR